MNKKIPWSFSLDVLMLYYSSSALGWLWKSLAESEMFSGFQGFFFHNTETTAELLEGIHLYLLLANANMFYTLQRERMVTWGDIITTGESLVSDPVKKKGQKTKTWEINRRITCGLTKSNGENESVPQWQKMCTEWQLWKMSERDFKLSSGEDTTQTEKVQQS